MLRNNSDRANTSISETLGFIKLLIKWHRITDSRFLSSKTQRRKSTWLMWCGSGISVSHKVLYRVSQEECARLREGVPYVKVYRYNPKHLYPKLNGYGDNGQRKLGLLAVPNTTTCTADTSRDNSSGLERGMQCSLCLRDALRSQPCYVTAGLSHVRVLVTLRTTMTWVRVSL